MFVVVMFAPSLYVRECVYKKVRCYTSIVIDVCMLHETCSCPYHLSHSFMHQLDVLIA